jgi:hypothetical protein
MSFDSYDIQYKFRDYKNSKAKIVKEIKAKSFTRTGMFYIDGDHIKYKFTLGDIITIKNGKPLTIIGKIIRKHH